MFRKFFGRLGRSNWSIAIREEDFAKIADWFIMWFFGFGGVCLLSAAVAAYFSGKPLDPKISADHVTSIAFGLRVFAMSAIEAGACSMVGWLFGLLFGIPRSLARPQPQASAGQSNPSSNQQSQSSGGNQPTSSVNTNLEDISDWLTKTLVGVGLTQLTTLPKFLGDLAAMSNQYGFGWQPYGNLLAMSVILYFTSGGFWLGYVGTRTILTKLFDRFDSQRPMRLTKTQIEQAAAPSNLEITKDGAIAADPGIASVDRALLRTQLQSLTSPEEVMAWAAAQARSGNGSAATAVLESQLQNDPLNLGLKQQLATIYTALGNHQRASALWRDAPDTPTAVLNALYEKPDGFEKAIATGERLRNDPRYRDSSNLHVWLACAYGQQYKQLKDNQASQVQLDAVKKNVLREIDEALKLDSGTKANLRAFWKPSPNSEDDDLSAFSPDDPDLQKRLSD